MVRFEMTLVIVDHGSGNLRSAAKGFEKKATEEFGNVMQATCQEKVSSFKRAMYDKAVRTCSRSRSP